jgi:hypothetical protein
VLDTGALLAYANGDDVVGEVIVDASDVGGSVALPLVCLIEAYCLLRHDGHDMLRALRVNRAVRTDIPGLAPERGDDCALIGGMARHAGRLGAGHAAFAALLNAAGVVTSRPDQLRAVLGERWEIIEV